MLRISLITVVFYTWGAPAFDGYRPMAIDRAVKSFHTDVNTMARDTVGMVSRAQHSSAGRFIANYREETGRVFNERIVPAFRGN